MINAKQAAYTLLLAGAFCSANFHAEAQKKDFTLTGHIKGLPDGELYLAYGTMKTMKADTVVAKNGSFVFKGKVSEPSYAMLFNKTYTVKIDLYVDAAAPVTIKGNMDSLYDANVQGSAVVNEYAKYNQAQNDTRKPVQVIYEQWMKAYNDKDSIAVEKYKTQFNRARNEQSDISRKMQLDFIQEHPNHPGSAWELMHYLDGKTLEKSKGLFGNLSKTVQASEQGKEVAARIATLSRISVGQMAPNFQQLTTENAPVTLAAYKGKYVLLEFWASWCGPCRAESPNLLKEYNHYKDKGFDVLAVSLDDKKDKWVEAIKKDDMPWTQVSDLKGWKNEVAGLYGINAVPANFLIDPTGKIVARDLRGEELGKALAKIFPM
ncbi:TlpA disulfide reductase family protein [Pinibacter aurantiacus]|uniref:AhpC/TSA family protein n=1 Tax=Pinibacter aurantiacus TaxID=2851599 RepID=A0A9E2W6L4_9BACT|nr:TlpA disulfide reductase family protein [Pinibacter aurantiacus]MBV4360169.1 AhpC/TSA family protein [Pinibacter aurantiacus]